MAPKAAAKKKPEKKQPKKEKKPKKVKTPKEDKPAAAPATGSYSNPDFEAGVIFNK
jgi:hypothetical protein